MGKATVYYIMHMEKCVEKVSALVSAKFILKISCPMV